MIGFIINPVSGNGRGASVWRSAERILRERNVAYKARLTTCAGEAVKLTSEMLSEGDMKAIVAVGGDGTIYEVVNGMRNYRLSADAEAGAGSSSTSAAPCLFGCLAAGSGNDFVRGHRIPTNPALALNGILLSVRDGKEKLTDVMRIGDRLAVNAVGAGLDGQVADMTNKAVYKKWLNAVHLGKMAYVLSLLRVLPVYKPADVALRIDGRTERLSGVWLIAVANIPYYGGGMRIAPDALADDGTLRIIAVGQVGRMELLRVFPLVYKGAHIGHPAVSVFSGASVSIEPDRPLVVHADGEIVPSSNPAVDVVPQWLRIPVYAKKRHNPLQE